MQIGMSRRVTFYLVTGIAFLCSIILFLNPKYAISLQNQVQTTLALEFRPLQTKYNINKGQTTLNITQQVINQQRRGILNDMKSYQYPNGTYDKTAKKLEDLLIERNGKPIRSIILSTWRSGSTFLGDVINELPANFYHYEPLLDFDIVQIRGVSLGAEALTRVKSLLNCDYREMDGYLNFAKTYAWVFMKNYHFWKQCELHKDLCYKPEFLKAMCELFPFQSMKLVRLRLNVAQELLADENLSVRMVLLVRDPRGTLQSRKHLKWCSRVRDCFDPALLCADLAADYKVAVELQKKYPNTFKVIRYEDLSGEPYKRVEELSKFFGIGFHKKMETYLNSHTEHDGGGVSSTFRDTKKTPYHWKTELKFKEVNKIQRSCTVAMKYWGYLPALNATHQKQFNPVTGYTLI